MDDNERWRRFMRCLFEKIGSVSECSDGQQALEAYNLHRPDWVFMDVSMNQMDGFTAAAQIKSRHRAARIIFLTQYSDADYRARAHPLGEAFLLKDEVERLQQMIATGFFHSTGDSL